MSNREFNRRPLILLFALAIVTLYGTAPVIAQRMRIDSARYHKWIDKEPTVPWYKRSRRVTTTTETFVGDYVGTLETRITEVLLPDRRRTYTKMIEDGKISEFEQITIDYMQYTRKDAGAWTKVDLRGQGQTGSGYGAGTSAMVCSEFSVEPVSLDGLSLRVFERFDVESVNNELVYSIIRDWRDEEGLVYRGETSSGKVNPHTLTRKVVTEYEYDISTIKIEAPIP